MSFFISLSWAERILYHTVQRGETLERIAQRYGVSIEDLKKWNNLKSNRIVSGQRLVVKKTEGSSKSSKSKKTSSVSTKETLHIVKKGETLERIAQKYGVSIEDLKKWNNLRSNKVFPGQKLVVKGGKGEAKKTKTRTREIVYIVKSGDTLSEIAQLFGVSEEEIKQTNNLKSSILSPKQKLIIRKSEEEIEEKTFKEEGLKSSEFKNLENYFKELQNKESFLKKKPFNQRNYLNLISEYRRFYLLYPGSELAPLALFKTGELYLEIYSNSLNKSSALEAAKRFELFLKNYPNHPLSNKAYLYLSKIYKEDLKNKRALKDLEKKYGKPLASTFKNEKRENPILNLSTNKTAFLEERKKVLTVEPISGEDYTRIIIDLTGDFDYNAHLLPKDKDKPPRLYIDLFPAILDEKVTRSIDLADKHLQRIRIGQFDSQTVRIVLDLRSLTDYKFFKLKSPSQLIVDLIGKEKRSLAQSKPSYTFKAKKEEKTSSKKELRKDSEDLTKSSKPSSKETEYLNLARQLGLGVKRIMLDPGHGGEDPGAVGPNGLKEKDVVLKIAHLVGKKLKEKLEVEVLFTRTTDIFIPLAKRPALANSQKADLFVSIHLNASPDPHAKGIETYYLNFTTDPEAMRVAALENRANDMGLADLQDLIKVVLANTKLKESQLLGEKVQRELVRNLSKYYPNIEDRGVKYAPFLVLVGTRMPAILIEADFISNPLTAERFTQEEYLEKIAEGITKGIEAYIQSLKLSKVP